METILVTGGAGFIGSNLADTLLDKGYHVIAVDNFDDFYEPAIKRSNISRALARPGYTFIESDVCNTDFLLKVLPAGIFAIIHLAAKAGVRNSILYPAGYEENNTRSLTKAIELAVQLKISRFIFTSSSSIYGNSKQVPFREDQTGLAPLNPYAISKMQSEYIGKKCSEKHDLTFISLRLFSVYGPRLRPDLMMTSIAKSLYSGQPLKIFGNGSAVRDFTHVSDIADGIINALSYSGRNYDLFNLGYGSPASIMDVISIFENITGEKIKLEFSNAIRGESDITWADNTKAKNLLNFHPKITLYDGVKDFLQWFAEFNHIQHLKTAKP
ncbi:MAG TPA: NAD-dependent epimerase/dehydratase family protein [Bacteroidales bacterium]|nr:NAD-dependent epimerase/dehydratase family protein [Bacteroidales bacterium]